MKNVMIAFLLLSSAANSQQLHWVTDIDKALREAAVANKEVLLFFTVSEQCENCEKLDKNIFGSEAFQAFAKENYIPVRIDFSQKPTEELTDRMIEKNLLIIEKYNKDGFFPLVVVLDKNAKVLGKTGVYKEETPAQFVSLLRKF
ncbi:thioredoxin family protein [Flavobacterium pallidum]|uniref:Thioredoxin family protein n=1 Tax=Flavobacterium pallidum TaxID=2172098 RepID=A0A2S1SJE4_9FLAO|nr:thioredoxin family protein [Flavobacterium pallidum]AWI26515.1 thioredoxin family protein [Flavobacterium pallidum]